MTQRKKITGLYNGQQNYIKLIKFLKKFQSCLNQTTNYYPMTKLVKRRDTTPCYRLVWDHKAVSEPQLKFADILVIVFV